MEHAAGTVAAHVHRPGLLQRTETGRGAAEQDRVHDRIHDGEYYVPGVVGIYPKQCGTRYIWRAKRPTGSHRRPQPVAFDDPDRSRWRRAAVRAGRPDPGRFAWDRAQFES